MDSSQSEAFDPDRQAPEPARKGLIRSVRELPKGTLIWIQGVVVATLPDQIMVDDGSGIARVHTNKDHKSRDGAFIADRLQAGAYVLVIGKMHARLKNHRAGISSTTIRDLSANAPFLECMWNLEVVDAFLSRTEAGNDGVT